MKKSYRVGWTEEIFIVCDRIARKPPVYKLKDAAGELIEGTFYEAEIQQVTKNDNVYKVESILKTRKNGRQKEYFVKWLGYPMHMASWVSASDLKTI